MLIIYVWMDGAHVSLACTGLGSYSFHMSWVDSKLGKIPPDKPRSCLHPVVDTAFMGAFPRISKPNPLESVRSVFCNYSYRIGIPSIQDGNWSGADEAAIFNWLLHGQHRDAEMRPTGPINLLAKIGSLPVNLFGAIGHSIQGRRYVPINYNYSVHFGLTCHEMVWKCLKAAFHHSESNLHILYTGGFVGFNFLDWNRGKKAMKTLKQLVARNTKRNFEVKGCQVIGRVNEIPLYKLHSFAKNGEAESFYYLWKESVWDSRKQTYAKLPDYFNLEHSRARCSSRRGMPLNFENDPDMPPDLKVKAHNYWHFFDSEHNKTREKGIKAADYYLRELNECETLYGILPQQLRESFQKLNPTGHRGLQSYPIIFLGHSLGIGIGSFVATSALELLGPVLQKAWIIRSDRAHGVQVFSAIPREAQSIWILYSEDLPGVPEVKEIKKLVDILKIFKDIECADDINFALELAAKALTDEASRLKSDIMSPDTLVNGLQAFGDAFYPFEVRERSRDSYIGE